MAKSPLTTKDLQQLQQLKLSESARGRMQEALNEHADFHVVSTAAVGGSRERVNHAVVWYTAILTRLKMTPVPALAMVAVVLIGGGTSLAAQGSLPGEFLYPVKIGVNEEVRGALALSADAEAQLQVDLLEERVEEAATLEAAGRLNSGLSSQIAARVEAQADAAKLASVAAAGDESKSTASRIRLALSSFASLTGRGGVLATRSSAGSETRSMAMSESASADAVMSMSAGRSAMMVAAPVDLDTVYVNTRARIASLQSVLEQYEFAFRTDVYTEYTATLDEAAGIIITVNAGVNETDARELLFAAADLVATVEAAVSSRGEIEIDPETGAIVGLELDVQPVVDEPVSIEPLPMPVALPTDRDIETGDGGALDGSEDEALAILRTLTISEGATEPVSLIEVTVPAAGDRVTNPITVSGQARGQWFFEASAPVVVTNWDGLIIGEGYVTTDGEWMTEEFVSFSGSVEYDLPADSYSASGTVIFQRSNPSGLPEHDAAVEVPVVLQ